MDHINEIFYRLDEWRNLPSYQLERRFDIFFSLYLPSILNSKYKTTISGILPEFPVRVGFIKSGHKRPNKSFKIDYLALSTKDKRAYFVELKTDNGSIRKEQMENMKEAKRLGLRKLIDGIIDVHSAAAITYSKYKTKHLFLLEKLRDLELVVKKDEKYVSVKTDFEIKIVLIEPQKSTQTLNECDIILFEEIIPIINLNKDAFSMRISKSLKLWKDNPVM
jgi:hypothetical protein